MLWLPGVPLNLYPVLVWLLAFSVTFKSWARLSLNNLEVTKPESILVF